MVEEERSKMDFCTKVNFSPINRGACSRRGALPWASSPFGWLTTALARMFWAALMSAGAEYPQDTQEKVR